MKENLSTIIVIIVLLLVGVLMNSCNNHLKKVICENDGGTFVYNVTNAEQTTCIEVKK